MSVDISGYLLGHVSHERILDTIKTLYDPNAYMDIEFRNEGPIEEHPIYVVEYYGDDGNVHTTLGRIMFKIPGEQWERGMFYYYTDANTYEMIVDSIESGYQLSKERIDIDTSETTFIAMKYLDGDGFVNTECLMKNIINHLGISGWISDDASGICQSYNQILKFS